MKNDELQMLANVIHTLGTVTVSGKENMSKLLGCIEALEGLVRKGADADGNENA